MKERESNRKYRWLSLIYDQTVSNPWFERARRREFELARIGLHSSVLIVGIGTGLDIPYLPREAATVGIDVSQEMLKRAEQKIGERDVSLLEMSAEDLTFGDQSFDVVIMNLVLSVVSDPKRALREASRVLKPSGSIWLLHKENDALSVTTARKLLNRVTRLIGSADITRSVSGLIQDLPLQKTHEESHFLTDIIQLRRR